MTAHHKHIIKKQVLHIRIARQDEAWQIQNRLSAFYTSDTVPILDDICGMLVGRDEHIFIDKLEIDIGRIPLLNMEEAFKGKIRTLFYEALSDRLGQARLSEQHLQGSEEKRGLSPATGASPAPVNYDPGEGGRDDEVMTQERYNLALISHFLRSGTFPWWAEKMSMGDLEKVFLTLLEEPAPELKSLIAKELSRQNAGKRFLYQFTDELFLRVSQILKPHASGWLAGFMTDMLSMANKAKLAPLSRPQIRSVMRGAMLDQLLFNGGASFSEKEMAASIVQAFSRTSGMDFKRAALLFADELGNLKKRGLAFQSRLPHLLARFSDDGIFIKDMRGGDKDDRDNRKKNKGREEKDAPQFSGDDAASGKADPAGDKGAKGRVEKTSDFQGDEAGRPLPEEGAAVFTKDGVRIARQGRGRSGPGGRIAINEFEENDLSVSAKKTFSEAGRRAVEERRQKDGTGGGLEKESGGLHREIAGPSRDKERMPGPFSQGGEHFESYARGREPWEREPLADDIYIENAGLVILWPYMTRFFRHLDLLKDDCFVDHSSAMRAIHLLQYLATGEEQGPEYFLPLNKLLCGWDLSKPLERKVPLRKKEKSESEALLKALVGHWQALGNTSVDGLRTSFLQREGALTEKEKNWHLKVEGKTYDILMERLPWGISTVTLPWMKKILSVEW
ncbi:MAG: contractile injection system tape measure protein [Deltaproteobacteria bacterium]|nr:contractile injection system tape measure protein [Deltaproteobacteria bacterium]